MLCALGPYLHAHICCASEQQIRTVALAVMLALLVPLLVIMLGMVARQADADRRVVPTRCRLGGVR